MFYQRANKGDLVTNVRYAVYALAVLGLPVVAAEVPWHEIHESSHLGSVFGEILSALAVILVAANLVFERQHRRKAEKAVAYDHLDQAYQDLYSIAARDPSVIDPARTWNIDRMAWDERLRYEAYAWKVWVVCETIFDQTRGHEDVWSTWRTALDIEARLHIDWVMREMSFRSSSFKAPFREWLCMEYGNPKQLQHLRLRALARYAYIRVATAEDITRIMELERLGFESGVLETSETFEKRISIFPTGFYVLMVPDESKPIGYICTEIWSQIPAVGDHEKYELDHDIQGAHSPHGRALYISSQTVDPKFWGASLGEFMFRECIALVCEKFSQLNSAVLLVNVDWTAAKDIYAKCGFKAREQIPGFFQRYDKPVQAALVMERALPMGWK